MSQRTSTAPSKKKTFFATLLVAVMMFGSFSATAASAAAKNSTVENAQQKLNDLGYWAGITDGIYGTNTKHAITAFQKVEGLPRTGKLDGQTIQKLSQASRPTAQKKFQGNYLEIDLSKQVLYAVKDGTVLWTFDTSTGKSSTPTPTGGYSIGREIDGFRYAPLGVLYRPKYFNRGIAIHGSLSVPTTPASHGCARVTYRAMDFIWRNNLASIRNSVYVYT